MSRLGLLLEQLSGSFIHSSMEEGSWDIHGKPNLKTLFVKTTNMSTFGFQYVFRSSVRLAPGNRLGGHFCWPSKLQMAHVVSGPDLGPKLA